MKLRCSRCASPITDYVIKLGSSVTPMKMTTEGTLLPLENISEPTFEYICKDCFNKYCECIDKLNEEYQGEYIANMVEVVDDIQYDIE